MDFGQTILFYLSRKNVEMLLKLSHGLISMSQTITWTHAAKVSIHCKTMST